MADDKKEKVNHLKEFRAKIKDKAQLTKTLEEGLKHTNAKVRQAAMKLAYKTQESAFVKKHVTPLLKGEQTKRVIATFVDHFPRKDMVQKLKDLAKQAKAAAPKKEEKAAAAPEPAKETPPA